MTPKAIAPGSLLDLAERVEREAPREESDDGAIEWVASRLTERQLAALNALTTDIIGTTAAELGVSALTLWSLSDFRRGERGIMAPLSLTTWDWNWDGKREWRLTKFGSSVLAHQSGEQA
jgi:hypothetical protein